MNGECPTDYQVKARHDSGRVKTVYKKKDLSLCKDRSETNLGIPVTQYPTEKVCVCTTARKALVRGHDIAKFLTFKNKYFLKSCNE